MLQEALNLWSFIQNKTGIYKNLNFIEDQTMKVGSYKIQGDIITYKDDEGHGASVYAVAKIASELFKAVMLYPSKDQIYFEPGVWKDLDISYTPPYTVCNFVNNPVIGDERTWFWWHHIPNYGTGGASFNRSWWLGLVKKYPQLGPKSGVITDHTKPYILHPDFPKIIYDEWVLRGKPNTCHLFEIDGTGYWWVSEYIAPPPANLNLGELNRYHVTLSSLSARYSTTEILPNGRYRMYNVMVDGKGKAFPLTENLTESLKEFNNNTVSFRGSYRYNYIEYYVEAYKNIQKYFDEQGATHVRFNVLGYSAYRVPTRKVMDTDLSRFNVYYTSPVPSTWTQKDMMDDRRIFNSWKATGAKVIWRPNLWFGDRFYPHFNFQKHTAYVRLVQPDGIWITGYTPGAIPFTHGINYYTMFRQLQGVRFQQSVQEYIKYKPKCFTDYYKKALELTQQFNIPWNKKVYELPDCIEKEAAIKYIEFTNNKISYDEIISWWDNIFKTIPGSGMISRVRSSVREKTPEEA